jgi:hypothetical protein
MDANLTLTIVAAVASLSGLAIAVYLLWWSRQQVERDD